MAQLVHQDNKPHACTLYQRTEFQDVPILATASTNIHTQYAQEVFFCVLGILEDYTELTNFKTSFRITSAK